MIDSELIKKCLQEDRRAQSELYRLLYKALIAVCWRYAASKEQAIEYMNLGFVKVLMNLSKYKEYDGLPFVVWAKKVVINNILSEFKKNKFWVKHNESTDDVTQFEGLSGFEDMAQQSELINVVKNKVLQLPPMTAKVFNLYAIDGYRHNEIAQMLGISEGTSMWHYSEAKKKIKQLLGLIQ